MLRRFRLVIPLAVLLTVALVSLRRDWAGIRHLAPDYLTPFYPVLADDGPDSASGSEAGYPGQWTLQETPRMTVHPIERLIERGRTLAADLQMRIQSILSVDDAERDYREAFGMSPPRGFEYWYKFTQLVNSQPMPSLIPFTHAPFDLLLSHSASLIKKRIAEAKANPHWGVYTFTFVPDGQGDLGTACAPGETWHKNDAHKRGRGRIQVAGMAAWDAHTNETLRLLLPILPYMPPEMFILDPPLEIAISRNDNPGSLVDWPFIQRSKELTRKGEVWDEQDLADAEAALSNVHGMSWACPEDAPLRQLREGRSNVSTDIWKSFITKPTEYFDICQNPSLMELNNELLNDKFWGANPLRPIITNARLSATADMVSASAYLTLDNAPEVPWAEKIADKLHWRGRATGMGHSAGNPWLQSQRERLHLLVQDNSSNTLPIMVQHSNDSDVVVEHWPMKQMNEAWMDVGLVGNPGDCNKEDGTCDLMTKLFRYLPAKVPDDAEKYQYLLDIDGNAWSARFRRLLSGNSVVFKATVYPEWYQSQLIPWYHYIPLKYDYSDLYDILAFFKGTPDGTGVARADLAQMIAYNGYRFTREQWRTEDMQSFVFLLYLEYWRLTVDDRTAGSYRHNE